MRKLGIGDDRRFKAERNHRAPIFQCDTDSKIAFEYSIGRPDGAWGRGRPQSPLKVRGLGVIDRRRTR